MRLICPNCGAQYEVDPGVIPETGRDVQCSNCGHSWFQKHSQNGEEAKPQPAQAGTPSDEDAQHQDADNAKSTAADEHEASPEHEAAQPQEPATPPEPAPEPTSTVERSKPQTGLNDDVASILQEEAARETREREAAAGALETQPDLGLEQAAAGAAGATVSVEEQIARLHELEGQDDENASDAESRRKEALPDIEEINSTLSPESSDILDDGGVVPEVSHRNGFRRGFLIAVTIFALMALIYVFAPKIADMVPATAGLLSAYVEWVNGLRAGLDSLMLRAVEKLTGILDNMGGNATG